MKEWTEIYEQMRGTFAQRAGFVPSEGCDSAVRLYALAAELQSLLMQADWVLDQSFPQTAQGTYLDYHAETRGITRGAAEKAAGVIRFAAADKVTAACPIEKGTVCMTAEGVRFETTEDAAIAVGSQWVDVPAQAAEAGAGGNVIAGTVTLLSAMPVGVVQCTNPAAFSGGCDAESDEALRGRVLASYQRLPNGANAAYYEQEAMRYPGVAAAKAVGRARGIGTVNVVIATHAGVPDAALLAAVETDLQKKREIAVGVKVLAPAVETVAVTAAQGGTGVYLCRGQGRRAERAGGAVYRRAAGEERDDGEAADAALRCGGRGERASDRTGGGCGGRLDGAANARHGDDQ